MIIILLVSCIIEPSYKHDAFSVTNETSKNVTYIDDYEYPIEIIIPSGEKKQIIDRWEREPTPPECMDFGCFVFDDTLTLQYHPRDTFSRNIYRNYEIEKISEKKYYHEAYYHYTLTEKDYQNALQQNQR